MKKHWNLIISLLVVTGGATLFPVSSFVPPVQAQVSQNSELEAYGWYQQGREQFDKGQTQEAIASWQQALSVLQETDNRYRQGLVFAVLGSAHFKLGEYQQSLEYFEQSVEIAREFKNRQLEGITLCGVGMSHYGLNDLQQAVNFCSQGLAIAREIDDRELQAIILPILSHAHFALGQSQQGSEYLQQARNLELNAEKSNIYKKLF